MTRPASPSDRPGHAAPATATATAAGRRRFRQRVAGVWAAGMGWVTRPIRRLRDGLAALWLAWKERAHPRPEHLRRGRLGEAAARRHLEDRGLRFLTANFRSTRGEIDLVFRDGETLVFVEVKTRTAGGWTRPAAAVNARKRRLLSQTALDYLRRLPDPRVRTRFDVVEVLLEAGEVREIRHLPATFALSAPYRYG